MMKNDNKLEIYRDEEHMGISLKWHTASGYGLLFFAFIWNLFLVFWYTGVLASGADMMALLFPMFHVAVGIFMAYTGIANLINKTIIDLYDGKLYVEHKPLPWWRGKRTFDTENIQQVYVKEKVSHNKNGTSRSYSIWALFKNGKKKELLNAGNISSAKAKEIENHIEDFLSITDQPVKEEYGNSGIVRQVRQRQLKKNFTDRALNYIYHCHEKDILELDKESFAVISVSQYDWNNGETDKLLQLFDENQKEQLLHLEQNRAILSSYLEKEISLATTGFVRFDTRRPIPLTIIEEEHFSFKEQKTGLAFNSSMNGHVDMTQWLYENEAGNKSLRVVDYGGQLSFYLGEKIDSKRFGNTLDLKEALPEKKKEYRSNWDEEDLI